MDTSTYHSVQLESGEVSVYDFGVLKLHNYNSNDPLNDQVIILEQNAKAIVIENPSFINSGRELTAYLKEHDIKVLGKLLSYHLCGAHFLPEVPVYSTHHADTFGHSGGGKAMVDGFAATFGTDFDELLDKTDIYLEEKKANIGGFKLELNKTDDAFDVEILVPHFQDMRLLYMHMLAADTHAVVKSKADLNATIKQLRLYHNRGYALILSAHHTPENSRDLLTKISYLHELDALAQTSKTATEFKTAMLTRFPNYQGEHFLEMTTGFLFG